MILKKTITDNDTTSIIGGSGCTNYNLSGGDDYHAMIVKKKKTKKTKKKRSSSFESSSQASSSNDSTSLYSTTSSTVQTDRTSLGKTIRGTYKSYSEKFLAQQEEEKQRCLLAIMEGTPLDQLNIYGNGGSDGGNSAGDDAGQLLLTNGPIDPDADKPSQYRDGGGETTITASQDGDSTFCSTTNRGDESSFKKSSHTMGSNRRGVYGGGVQYFTPDNGKYDEDEDEDEDEVEESEDGEIGCSDDEDFEEEDEDDEYTHQDDYEEEYDNEGENGDGGEGGDGDEGSDTIELEGSDMESMFSNDDDTSYDHHQNSVGVDSVVSDGVDSATTFSTAEQNEVLRHYNNNNNGSGGGNHSGNNKRRGRRAPDMTPISDGSASSSNC